MDSNCFPDSRSKKVINKILLCFWRSMPRCSHRIIKGISEAMVIQWICTTIDSVPWYSGGMERQKGISDMRILLVTSSPAKIKCSLCKCYVNELKLLVIGYTIYTLNVTMWHIYKTSPLDRHYFTIFFQCFIR